MNDFTISPAMVKQAAHARQDQAALQLISEAARTNEVVGRAQSQAQAHLQESLQPPQAGEANSPAIKPAAGSGRGSLLDTFA